MGLVRYTMKGKRRKGVWGERKRIGRVERVGWVFS